MLRKAFLVQMKRISCRLRKRTRIQSRAFKEKEKEKEKGRKLKQKKEVSHGYLFDTPNYMLVMIPGIYFHFNCFFPYQENIKGRFENGVMNEKFEEFCGDQYIPKLKI